MFIIQLLFWTLLFVLFFAYIGFGLLLAFIVKIRKNRSSVTLKKEKIPFPAVTMIIAAYDEEDIIREKINNCLQIDYPKNRIHFWFVTDGSTDNTGAIIKEFPQVYLFHEEGRNGKIHAVNRVMKEVSTPIVVFSDANTMVNREAVKYITAHYADPNVGAVSGEKRIEDLKQDNASGSGEGMYWKYESWMKKNESDLYSLVGAAGELFSVRTSLYEPVDKNVVIEDFLITVKIAMQGYKVVYEPRAVAVETASLSVEEEKKRKVRIAAGGFQAMKLLSALFNPIKYGTLSWLFLGHRVLRWTLAPIAIPLVFGINIFLAHRLGGIYEWLLVAQGIFYGIALLGWLLQNYKVPVKGFFIPFYFLFMNFAVYQGFIRHLNKCQSVVWEKSKRA